MREPIDDERFTCPKWTGWGEAGSHFWYERDGFRTCSHCGCLHPDDWIATVRESITTGGRLRIDRGKPGKWYVHGRTTEGRTIHGKFYAIHMPEDKRMRSELSDQLHRALRVSWDNIFRNQKERSAIERLGDVAAGG